MIIISKNYWQFIILLILSIATGVTMLFTHPSYALIVNNTILEKELAKNLTNTKLVAHACGKYNGMAYTNSLNALDASYENGFRLFEVDFHFTSDHHIVLIHDWNGTEKKLLGTTKKVYSYNKFKNAKVIHKLVLMDIDTLVSWLKIHNDAFIVTDCKDNNLVMLKDISTEYPNMTQRFLPQMGLFSEYQKLKQIGYKNIILALYKTNYVDDDIIKFVKTHNLIAVSMPEKRAETNLPLKLKKLNVEVFAHTVNSLSQYRRLLNNGVYGIYTDSIVPNKETRERFKMAGIKRTSTIFML